MTAEDVKKNLGQEIFQKDGKPKKVKYKAQSDNGTTKLHLARFGRPPLSHPKEYYKHVPKKHDVIIRNFPMEHLGLTGQVSENTVGKLHNRSVPLTFEAFGKASHKAGKPGCPAGKYSDLLQLQEGLLNYGALLLLMWNHDYTAFVIWRVLHDSNWGEIALPDEKRRSELVIEFFNSMLADNCGKAVHDEYPVVFEQVKEKKLL